MSARALLLIGLTVAAPAFSAERTLHVRVAHAFSIEDAKARMEMLLTYWKERFGAEYRWEDATALVSGRVFGIAMTGKVVVDKDSVDAFASDPGPLFRRIGQRYVERKLRKYLHPDYREP